MNTYYNGFDSQEVTFKTAATLTPKRAVALQNSGDVYYPESGEPFTGIVTDYRNGIATVVIRGWAEVNFKNTLPTIGICRLAVGSSGCLEADYENGKPYTVLNVNTKTKTMEIIL